jgi:hypothetical protein
MQQLPQALMRSADRCPDFPRGGTPISARWNPDRASGLVDPGPTGLESHVETPSHFRSRAQVSSSSCCAVCFATSAVLLGQRHRRDVEGAPHEHAGDPCAWSLFPADAVNYRPRATNQQFPQMPSPRLLIPPRLAFPQSSTAWGRDRARRRGGDRSRSISDRQPRPSARTR